MQAKLSIWQLWNTLSMAPEDLQQALLWPVGYPSPAYKLCMIRNIVNWRCQLLNQWNMYKQKSSKTGQGMCKRMCFVEVGSNGVCAMAEIPEGIRRGKRKVVCMKRHWPSY